MGKVPQMDSDDPQFVGALEAILRSAKAHGVAPGIHVADAQAAQRRIQQGWQFIAVSSELGFMNQAASAMLQSLGPVPAGTGSIVRY
jgi:4-hydroxy-2-oxoheptanedioate aldolase